MHKITGTLVVCLGCGSVHEVRKGEKGPACCGGGAGIAIRPEGLAELAEVRREAIHRKRMLGELLDHVRDLLLSMAPGLGQDASAYEPWPEHDALRLLYLLHRPKETPANINPAPVEPAPQARQLSLCAVS